MESLAFALLAFFMFFLAASSFILGCLGLLALLHGARAEKSRRSARAARWIGLLDMLIAGSMVAYSLTATGSFAWGEVDNLLLLLLAGVILFFLGGYGLAQSFRSGSNAVETDNAVDEDRADRKATRTTHLRAFVGGIVTALVVTVGVLVLGWLFG